VYTQELMDYCQKHNLEPVTTYDTYGEERGPHHRAIVRDADTGEQYYLYYDRSVPRRAPSKERADLDIYLDTGQFPPRRQRGWRNTTLDNRRRKARQDARTTPSTTA
jgi:hypothetical protein